MYVSIPVQLHKSEIRKISNIKLPNRWVYMVLPSPDFHRKITNTDNIVMAKKEHVVPSLLNKYPEDYIDVGLLNNLKIKKPWIEPITRHINDIRSQSTIPQSRLSKLSPGGDRMLVICMDFIDKPYVIPASTIYNRFFGTTGKTLRNYYLENSYGTYVPNGIVAGWYRAPYSRTYSYYRDDPSTQGCDYGMGSYPHNDQKLFEDALDMVNNDPNITNSTLSWLDANGDGYLDRVMVVHAGGEASYGGDCNEIWAVTWGIYSKTVKGKTFGTFATSAEYIDNPTNTQRSGVDCHEYGHILGLPDLYDYSGQTNGTGQWSLMSSGSWGNDYSITPSHLDAWSKYQFGWVTPVVNPRGLTYIDNVETNNQIVKYTTLDPKEYFLVENRQKIGFDTSLPGSGLLIWHINENRDQYADRYCHTVSLIQADGLQDLENQSNNGDLGDPYPGTANNRSFGMYTIPGSILCCSPQPCSGTAWNILINNISDSSYTMSFDSILPPIIVGSARFHTTPTGADIYFDTTYQGTTDIGTGILNIDNIPVGLVNYTISKVGYFDYTGSINIVENGTTYKLVTMTQVASATNILASPSTCQPPCNTTIGVAWINNDPIRSGSFYPAININGTRIPYTTPENLISISPGVTIAKMFNVSNLAIGNYTICPDPN